MVVLVDSFQAEGGTVKNLMRLVEGQFTLIERIPKLADQFARTLPNCRQDSQRSKVSAGGARNSFPQAIEAAQLTLVHGYDFFNIMSTCLEFIIGESMSPISPPTPWLFI